MCLFLVVPWVAYSLAFFSSHDEVHILVLIDFSLNVKATILIFIWGRGSAVPSAKKGKSGLIYNLVKS